MKPAAGGRALWRLPAVELVLAAASRPRLVRGLRAPRRPAGGRVTRPPDWARDLEHQVRLLRRELEELREDLARDQRRTRRALRRLQGARAPADGAEAAPAPPRARATLPGGSATVSAQQRILAELAGGPQSARALARAVRMRWSTALDALAGLVELGHVVREGRGRAARYRLADSGQEVA